MNLFLIAAPYQILSAIEAIHHLSLVNNILVILDTGLFKKSIYEQMIDQTHWNSVRFVPFVYPLTDRDFGKHRPRNLLERSLELYLTFDRLVKRRRIDRLCKSLGPVENLLLGNYLNDYDLHMRHVANKIRFDKLYLLDVGTDTLRISSQRVRDNSNLSLHAMNGGHNPFDRAASNGMSIAQRIKSQLRRSLIDWNDAGVSSLTYFTSYDLETSGNDHIVRNDYSYLRSLIRNAQCSDEILFIGQPVVDQEYLTLDTYLDHMRRVKAYFLGKQLFYVPHPREAEKYVEMVSEQIGIAIKRFDVSIENAITFGAKRPGGIAAFFSSAIVNFSAMFGDTIEITSFYLPEQHLLKDKAIVENIYCHLRSANDSNVKVV